MEKIIITTQVLGENSGALDLGCELALLTKSKLMVVVTSEESPPKEGSQLYENIKLRIEEKRDETQIDISFCLYEDHPEEAVLFESRFADLLIIAREPLLSGADEYTPTTFVKNILSRAECPVILAPRRFTSLNEIVFCYNGSSSSIFAIKQFSYLFPQYRGMKLRLLEIRDFEILPDDRARWLLHHNRTRDWMKSHYDNSDFTFLEGEPAKELNNFFATKENQLAVVGAFGRNTLSTVFKKSAADGLVRNMDLPLFVAHK